MRVSCYDGVPLKAKAQGMPENGRIFFHVLLVVVAIGEAAASSRNSSSSDLYHHTISFWAYYLQLTDTTTILRRPPGARRGTGGRKADKSAWMVALVVKTGGTPPRWPWAPSAVWLYVCYGVAAAAAFAVLRCCGLLPPSVGRRSLSLSCRLISEESATTAAPCSTLVESLGVNCTPELAEVNAAQQPQDRAHHVARPAEVSLLLREPLGCPAHIRGRTYDTQDRFHFHFQWQGMRLRSRR